MKDERVCMLLEKNADGKFIFKSADLIDVNDKNNDVLTNATIFDMDTDRYFSFSAGEATKFVAENGVDSDKIIIQFDKDLQETLKSIVMSDGNASDEQALDALKGVVTKLGENMREVTFEKHGDLYGCSIPGNSKEEEKPEIKNGPEVKKNDSEEDVIDISKINPSEIIAEIKQKVIAQDETVETIVNNIYDNQVAISSGDEDRNITSILFDGPTGTGKTFILKEVQKAMNLPMVIRSSTMYSATGYVGSDLSEMLSGLLKESNGNLELAERGIVVLDEFDKLSKSSENSLEMREAIQQELLTYMSGGKFPVEYNGKTYEFDTSKVTFICMGAFTDLRENKIKNELDDEGHYSMKPDDYINAGLMREIVGRFSLISATRELSRDDLLRVLKESKTSPLVDLKKSGEVYGKNIIWSEDVVERIADEAFKEGTGARALQTVVNGIKNVVLSDLINGKEEQIEITQETIDKSMEIYVREAVK